MVDGDIFREIEEDLRRDRFKKIWDRFGTLVAGAALAIVLGVAGYKGWQYWSAKQASESGAKYAGALALEADGKTQDAERAFQALGDGGPKGYRVLARLRMAAVEAGKGKKAEAVARYDALVADGDTDEILKGFARIQAAMLRLDTADWTEMKNRLIDLSASDSPWRYSARELLGLAAYKAGKNDEAERQYTAVLTDRNTPQALRRRAEMALALISGDAASSGKIDKPPPGSATSGDGGKATN